MKESKKAFNPKRKITVEKISKNKTHYRTPLHEIDGMTYFPKVGESLLLTSSTFVSGGF